MYLPMLLYQIQEHPVQTLSPVLHNRIQKQNDVFAVFVDFQKAFDLVDREALLYMLLH